MAKMVGLSRKLKLPWLIFTVGLVAGGAAGSEVIGWLFECLSCEIDGRTVDRRA